MLSLQSLVPVFFGFCVAQWGFAAAKPVIEVIPVAVWQGRPGSLLSLSLLDDLRKSWLDARIAHAVSAAPLARGEISGQSFKDQLASLTRSGDDILLHMAPWKSLADKANVNFKYAPTLFGSRISEDDCKYDCGLDMSFTVYSPQEVRAMIAASRKLLGDNGMGAPAAIYFDEGVTSVALHKAARQEGILQDWSGIEMSQMKSSLGRFPVYQMNREYSEQIPLNDVQKEQVDGLVLDHVRFGIHAEIADLDSSDKIFQSAIQQSQKINRAVRVPIIFNVDDLYYTHEFVRDAVLRARTLAEMAGVGVSAWVPQNLTWNLEKSKPVAAAMPLALSLPDAAGSSAEPEFIPQDELDLENSVEMNSVAH